MSIFIQDSLQDTSGLRRCGRARTALDPKRRSPLFPSVPLLSTIGQRDKPHGPQSGPAPVLSTYEPLRDFLGIRIGPCRRFKVDRARLRPQADVRRTHGVGPTRERHTHLFLPPGRLRFHPLSIYPVSLDLDKSLFPNAPSHPRFEGRRSSLHRQDASGVASVIFWFIATRRDASSVDQFSFLGTDRLFSCY